MRFREILRLVQPIGFLLAVSFGFAAIIFGTLAHSMNGAQARARAREWWGMTGVLAFVTTCVLIAALRPPFS